MKRTLLFLGSVLLAADAFGANTTSYTNTSTMSVNYNESTNTGNNGPYDWWANVVITIQAGSGFAGNRSSPVYINGTQIGSISSSVLLTTTLSRTQTPDPGNGYSGSGSLQNNGNTVYSGVISVVSGGYQGNCDYSYTCASSPANNGVSYNYNPAAQNITVTLNYPGPPLTASFPYQWSVNTWKNYELVATDTTTGQTLNTGSISGSTAATGTMSIVNVSNGDGYSTTVINPASGAVLETFDTGTIAFSGTNTQWVAPTMILTATDPLTVVMPYQLTSTGTGGGSAAATFNGGTIGQASVGPGTVSAPAVVSGSFTTTGLVGQPYGWTKSQVGGGGAPIPTQTGVVSTSPQGVFVAPLEEDSFGGGEANGQWVALSGGKPGEQVWVGSEVPPDFAGSGVTANGYVYSESFGDGNPEYFRTPVNPSPTPTPTATPTPTPSPTPNPSSTPIPSPTPAPSGTPIPTPTPPPNPSPTPPITTGSNGLDGQDIYTAVKQALEDAGNDNSSMPALNLQAIGGDPSSVYADHSGIYALQNGMNAMGNAGTSMKNATGTVMQTLTTDVQSIPTTTGMATSWDLGTYTYPGGQYHLTIDFGSLPATWFWPRQIELTLMYIGYLIACIRLIGSYLT